MNKYSKQSVAIIFGGASPEHGVSLCSAAAVLENIDRRRWEPVPVGITRDGAWYRWSGDVGLIASGEWERCPDLLTPVTVDLRGGCRGLLELRQGRFEPLPVDVAFPVLHGRNGEDGTVQGMLELAGIPCAGCGVLSSALCMDKDRAHKLAKAAGVRVPESVTFHKSEIESGLRAARVLGLPVFVKPLRAGSSFGITRVAEPAALEDAVRLALEYDDTVTVEAEVPGFEVGCAVLGTRALTLGRVDEVELASGTVFDFNEKYSGSTSRIRLPARVPAHIEERIRSEAVRIYRALDCRGFARVDMFLTPSNEVVFNEVNTIPGFTSHSRFPNMLRASGVEFSDVIDAILTDALEREGEK